MQTKFNRCAFIKKYTTGFIVRYIMALAVAPILLLTGCSHSAPPTAGPAPAVTAGGGAPSATAIQSDMDKVKADPSISNARKQIMLDQMQRAMAKTSGGK